MERIVQCRKCSGKDIQDEKLCNNCQSTDIYIDNIPSFSEVMEEVFKECEEKNKPTYDFLDKNEDECFVKKLLEFANEVCDLAALEEHHQQILKNDGFNWKTEEDYPNSDVILCDFKETMHGGYTGDNYGGYAYVRLPKSGMVFQFEYSC